MKVTILKGIWISYGIEWECEKKHSQVISTQAQILWHWQCPEDHSHSLKKKIMHFLQEQYFSVLIHTPAYLWSPRRKWGIYLVGGEHVNWMLGMFILPGIGGLQENIAVIWQSVFTDYPCYSVQAYLTFKKENDICKRSISRLFFPLRSVALCYILCFWTEAIKLS